MGEPLLGIKSHCASVAITCPTTQLVSHARPSSCCVFTTLPWMWLANTEVCRDLRLPLLHILQTYRSCFTDQICSFTAIYSNVKTQDIVVVRWKYCVIGFCVTATQHSVFKGDWNHTTNKATISPVNMSKCWPVQLPRNCVVLVPATDDLALTKHVQSLSSKSVQSDGSVSCAWQQYKTNRNLC